MCYQCKCKCAMGSYPLLLRKLTNSDLNYLPTDAHLQAESHSGLGYKYPHFLNSANISFKVIYIP